MSKTPQFVPMTMRVSGETKDLFEDLMLQSGIATKGEFLAEVLSRYFEAQNIDEPTPQATPQPQIIEKEKELKENEILLILNPAQLFALKETILFNIPNLKAWNEQIEKMKAGKEPFLYLGYLFDKDFAPVWNNFIEIESDQDLKGIKANIAAELLNSYMSRIIEGEADNTNVSRKTLRGFLRELQEPTSEGKE